MHTSLVHLFGVIVCCLSVASQIASAKQAKSNQDEWIDPLAWQRKRTTGAPAIDADDAEPDTKCPPCPASGDSNAERCFGDFAYRKLVNFLINEQRMHIDPDTGELQRTVNIRLSRLQYDQIRADGRELRDTDALLQDVWRQSQPGPFESARDTFYLWSERLALFWHGHILANLWLINGAKAAAGLAVLALARRHRIGIGLVLSAAVAFVVYNYLDAECHRRLENERVADLMMHAEQSAQPNPCDEPPSGSWLTSMSAQLFGDNRREKCVQYLASRYEKQCNVKTLYADFMRTFVFGTMQDFFSALLGITASIRAEFGFWGMIVVSVLIYANMGVLIASTFQHVIGPLLAHGFGFGRRPHRSASRDETETVGNATADRLSATNVDRLLTITESNSRLVAAMAETFRTQCSVSGVQIVRETLPACAEAVPEPIEGAAPDDQTDSKNSSSTSIADAEDRHLSGASKTSLNAADDSPIKSE